VSGEVRPLFSSEWHDPTDRIEVKQDERTGDVYHKGSYYEEWRKSDDKYRRRKKAIEHWDRLSKDPVRRGEQIRWFRLGVDPFDVQSLLSYARSAKNSAGRWLAMHDIDSFGLLGPSCYSVLEWMARNDRSQDNRMMALGLLGRIQRGSSEELYIELLQSKHFRFKITPVFCIHEYGTAKSVPSVSEFVKRAVKRRRQSRDRDTDLLYSIRFLDKHLDKMPVVEDVFKIVIRYWHNLGYAEAMGVLQWARYIGIRVLEPIQPAEDESPDRVTITTPTFRRRLWKDKSRFRYPLEDSHQPATE